MRFSPDADVGLVVCSIYLSAGRLAKKRLPADPNWHLAVRRKHTHAP
jgi:hypothetical protein